VHLTVADLERSLIFYRQQLGFADVWRRDGSAGSAWLTACCSC
jgi:catechol 2,3-dioxygenase-like lactoylglutathione lyase family enzyme